MSTPLIIENNTTSIKQERDLLKYKHTFFVNTLVVASCSTLIACASGVKKVDLPAGSNPVEELSKAEMKSKDMRVRQYDKLSPEHFDEAQESIADAQKKIKNGKKSEAILEEVGEALGHLREVEAIGEKYGKSVETVLQARQYAMDAGAPQMKSKAYLRGEEALEDLGEDMEDGDYTVDAKDLTTVEGYFLSAELDALRESNLGESRELIKRAENKDADDYAPQTYEEAKTLYSSADRSLDANRRNPSAFTDAVAKSLAASNKLNKVVDIAREKKINEPAALTIFAQNVQLDDNSESIALLKQRNQASTEKLSAASQKANMYATRETMERKIAEARNQFDPNEAEVLQDDNKLIVRLKKVNFDTASSDVNQESFATLEKVKSLITAVPEASVIVEGHTDSVGTAQVNQTLSKKRAESVKEYFVSQNVVPEDRITAEGYGFEKPLTSNKTKQGRAANRRVDVVIESKDIY